MRRFIKLVPEFVASLFLAMAMMSVAGCDSGPGTVVAGEQEIWSGSDLVIQQPLIDFAETGTSKQLEVQNVGDQDLACQLDINYGDGPENWLTISPITAQCNQGKSVSFVLAADRSALPAGLWSAEVAITSGTIRKTVVVSIAVVAAAASIDTRDFGTASDPCQFQVWNAGGGTLQYEVTNAPSWLTVDGAAGTSTSPADRKTVTVSPDRSNLAPGTYTGQVVIVPVAGQTGFRKTINVSMTVPSPAIPTLTIQASPAGGTAPVRIKFTAMDGGSAAANLPAGSTLNWDFGDLTAVAHGNPVTHTFTTSGSFLVALSLTLAGGLGTVGCQQTTIHITTAIVRPGALVVTPTDYAIFSGFQSGPFSPAGVTYTLTNNGEAAIDWTAAKTQDWVSLSKTSGSLAGGATDTVVISVNAAAVSLAAGSYGGSVMFVNTTNHAGDASRSVALTVNSQVVDPPVALTASAGGNKTINAGGSVVLSGSASGGTAPYTYSWSPTAGLSASNVANPTASPAATTTYTLTVHDAATGTATATAKVTLTPAPGVLSVTPSADLTSTGTQGGPFSPSSVTYTLTNTGGSDITWTASKTQIWVGLSKTTGTLPAGSSDTVTVSIATGANSLAEGNYSDTVTVTNATDVHGGTTRGASLTVTPLTGPPSTSPLGTNLEAPDFWNTSLPFKNLVKCASDLKVMNATTWCATGESVPSDRDGYPTSLPANRWAYFYLCYGTQGHYPQGDYVALYDGRGTLYFDLDASNVAKTGEGRYTFRVTTPRAGIRCFIKTTMPEDHIRNLRVLPAEFEGNETPQWHPKFLQNMSSYSVIRFMDWMRVSLSHQVTCDHVQASSANTVRLAASASSVDDAYKGMTVMAETGWQRRMISSYDGATHTATIAGTFSSNPATGSSYYISDYGPREWSQRSQASFYRQNDGWAGPSVEVMVDLCNTMGAAPWFNMPTAASDDYVRQFATYVHNHLSPYLKVYIEYSNETWNTSYPGFDYCTAKGAEIGINAWQYHSYRATQIHQIWSEIFGESSLRNDRSGSRLIRILASQASYYAVGTTIMDYNGSNLGPGSPNPFQTGKAAKDYADALAITGYMGTSDSDYDSLTVDQLLDKVSSNVTERLTTTWIVTNLANARSRGLDLVAYEGGASFVTDTNTPYVSGTAVGGDTGTIMLASGVSSSDDCYTGRMISITAGTGAGQDRLITGYAGSSRLVTVDSAWSTAPDSSSQYLIRIVRHFKQDAMNRSPRLKDIYLQMFEGWRTLGLDTNGKGCKIFCHFQDCGAWNQYGRWGAREYYDQSDSLQPKIQAIKQFVTTHTAWWQ